MYNKYLNVAQKFREVLAAKMKTASGKEQVKKSRPYHRFHDKNFIFFFFFYYILH